jgi:hypothetical protein
MMGKIPGFVQPALLASITIWLYVICGLGWGGEQAHALIPQGQSNVQFQALAVVRHEIDFAAMLPHDTAHNQETQSRTSRFGCKIRLENLAHVCGGNSSPRVRERNSDEVIM